MISSVAFHPDGELAVSADERGDVRIWRPTRARRPPAPHRRLCCAGHLQLDGSLVAAAGDWRGGRLALEERRTGRGAAPAISCSREPRSIRRSARCVARRRRNRSALKLARRARRRDSRRARLRLHRERAFQSRRCCSSRQATTATCACGTGATSGYSRDWSLVSGASLTSRSVRTDGSWPPSARMPRPSVGLAGAPHRLVDTREWLGTQPRRPRDCARRHQGPRLGLAAQASGRLRGHSDGVRSIAFSPNGCLVATAGVATGCARRAPPLAGCG